eukprot:gnl/Trimastix_PCT/394.p1 GENE.gnl/Trimastix_PCT/394~~gnl/Trimastix_PCT/394.p1  ORF type:complete len:415 (-),score=68.06 gnl/Trimastix_PCT/394:755-1999(-)
MSQTPSLSEVVHPGVRCQKCGQDPIRGIRYKCGNCEDYDLCETCEISSETFHNPEHLFVKIKKPLVDAPSRRLLPNLYRSAGSPTMTPPHHVPFPAGPIAPGPLLEMLRAESARFGVEANNSFTTALFRMINETNRGSPHNILISPLSLSIAITSAGNGAEGSTLETIARPFGYMGSFTDANSAMINHACRQFLLHLASHARSSDVRCFMATSMWIPSALYPRVKGEFKQLVHESCACDVLPHPQEGPITPAVDEWAASRTGGLVRNVAPSLSPSLAMFNLCAFEGKWRVPFASELVDMTFTSFGQSQLVKMMRADGVFEHVQMEGFQACSLPYGHTDADKNTFKATVILPDTPDLPGKLLSASARSLAGALPQPLSPRFYIYHEQVESQKIWVAVAHQEVIHLQTQASPSKMH